MAPLKNKIDFSVIIRVKNANPNGDPLANNRPRMDLDGYGEISDVCIKRKIRNRLQENGQAIFIQSDDRKVDEHKSLKSRAEAFLGKSFEKKEEIAEKACQTWYDVRSFGVLLAFGNKKEDSDGNGKKKSKKGEGVSISVRGPVSIQTAFSVEPISISEMQITKSVNAVDGEKKGSDTMERKFLIDREAIYVFHGSINPQLAEKTGFSDEDAKNLKEVLTTLFNNDSSSARPEGTMRVLKVIWWNHGTKSGKFCSADVHDAISVKNDGSFDIKTLNGLKPEILPGF